LSRLTSPDSQLRNFVLVAGYDHHGSERSRVDFAKLAANHAASLRNSVRGPSRFTLFDVARGLVSEQIVHGQDIVSTRTLAQREPVRQSHYQVQPSGIPAFRAQGVRTLSIVDVYEHVARIGAREPGTLIELAFVSHGWVGGPILVNSFDLAPSIRSRSTDDKDARPDKDFAPPNMSAGERRLFRAAFCAEKGRIFNFGCANTAAVRDVLDQLCRQWDPAHDRDHVYELVFDGSQLSNHRATDPDFFASESPTVTRSLAQCQAFLRRRASASYSQKIANAAGVRCWGAFPGTYSSYEQGVPFPVLFIGRGVPGYKKDFAPHLRFVTRSLGLTEDVMGRGFVEFLPRRPKAPSHEAHLPGRPAVADPRQDANVRAMAPSTGP
jgi:hypothetical protein